MTTNPDNKIKEQNNFKDVIKDCLDISNDGNYIFRGTNHEHVKNTNMIESSLYRQLKRSSINQNNSNLCKEDERIMECAKYLFPPNADEVEILTELRHYGEKLCIIDFTKNLFVALFFACQKTFDDQQRVTDKDGEIVLLEKPQSKPPGINHSDFTYAIEPASNHSSNKRVLAQSSIFVHTPTGFIDKSNPYEFKIVRIKNKFKEEISNYLNKFHNINSSTIYGDVIGFINDKSNVGLSNYELGMYASRVGQPEEAISRMTKVINNERSDPKYVYSSLISCAVAWLDLNDFDKAIDDCSKAIEMIPQNEVGFINRGIARIKKGEYTDALSDIDTCIDLDNKSNVNDAFLWRAVIYIKLKKYKESFEDIKIYLKREPISEEAIRLQELFSISLIMDRKTTTINEDYVDYRYQGRGNYLINRLCNSSKNIHINHLEILDKEILANPKNALTFINRGELKFHIKNFNDAAKDFDAAIQLLTSSSEEGSPHLLVALHYRGLSKMNSLDYNGAMEDFNKALKIYPFSPEILCDLATAFYSIGERAEKQDNPQEATRYFKIALTDLNIAIELNPKLISTYYIRQLVNYALGNYKEAQKDRAVMNLLNKKLLADGCP